MFGNFLCTGCSRYVMLTAPPNLTMNTVLADLVRYNGMFTANTYNIGDVTVCLSPCLENNAFSVFLSSTWQLSLEV